MFTGIIEEIGKIKAVATFGGGKRISVSASKIMDDLKIDDSVAINGVCQTVVAIGGNVFTVEAVEETLRKTNLGRLSIGLSVNLERALTLSTRLGGHLVQGHVDSVGKVKSIKPESAGILLTVSFPSEFAKYVARTGSVCINGISLTVARLFDESFTVSVIPHTWKMSTLGKLSNGDEVNLEYDVISKYIERLISSDIVETKADQTKSILDQFITQPF